MSKRWRYLSMLTLSLTWSLVGIGAEAGTGLMVTDT